MFYVYNIQTNKVECVEKIDNKIHRHRNTKEEFTFSKENVELEVTEKKVTKSKTK